MTTPLDAEARAERAIRFHWAKLDFSRHGICSADLPECDDLRFCGECGVEGPTDPDNDLCPPCALAVRAILSEQGA